MPDEVPGAPRLPFKKEQRLLHGWEFERTRTAGQRLARGCLILNWRIAQDQSTPRLGVVTSKKIGHAVLRSRARRVLREVFRLNQHRIARSADIVLVARQSIVGKTFAEVARDFLSAAKQAGLLQEVK